MKQISIIAFVAMDGAKFFTSAECVAHEQSIIVGLLHDHIGRVCGTVWNGEYEERVYTVDTIEKYILNNLSDINLIIQQMKQGAVLIDIPESDYISPLIRTIQE